jgi:hypothetical protein
MRRLLHLLRLLLCLAAATPTAVGGFDKCNICRAPNIVNNKDATIKSLLLGFLGLSDIFTCYDLDLIGQTGRIADSLCFLLQSRPSIRRTCACGPPGTPFTTPSPTQPPTNQPTNQPKTMKPKVPTTKKPKVPSTKDPPSTTMKTMKMMRK